MPSRPGASRGTSLNYLLLAAALLVIANLIGYGTALRGGFVSDDQMLVQARISEYQTRPILPMAFGQSFWKGSSFDVPRPGDEPKDYYRPLVTLSYALDARIWGQRAFGYHLTNLALHMIASFLVVLLLLQIGFARGPALGGGLLFACHPIHVASVAWIAGRTDLLCAVFLLAAMLALARHIDRRPAAAAPMRWGSRSLWLGLLAYLCALLAKEMALTFGGLVFLYAWMRRSGGVAKGGRRAALPWVEIGLVGCATVVYFAFRAAILGLPDFHVGQQSATSAFRLGMPPAVYAYYGRVLFYPGTLHFHVPMHLPGSAGDPRFLLATFLLIALVTATMFLFRRVPAAGLGAAWVLTSLLPVSHLVPLAFRTVVAEYWAYIPSIGFVILLCALAEAAQRRMGRPRAAVGALIVLSLAGIVQIPARSANFRTEEQLLRHTVSVHPGHVDSWVTLGAEYGSRGDTQRAFRCLYEARRRDPKARGLWTNLANLYDMRGDTDSAAFAYRKELETFPYKDDVKINLADVLIQQGNDDEAAVMYREAIARYPDNVHLIEGREAVVRNRSLDGRLPWPKREKGLILAAGMLRALMNATDWSRADLRAALVETELDLGRFDRAREACTREPLAASDPALCALIETAQGSSTAAGSAASAERLASLYQETGRTALAIPLWRALLRAGAIDPDRLNHVAALTLKDGGRPNAAVDAAAIWRLLLDEKSDYAYSLLNLGGIAYTAGDATRCRTYWDRFLRLYPDRPEATEVREKLTTIAGRR